VRDTASMEEYVRPPRQRTMFDGVRSRGTCAGRYPPGEAGQGTPRTARRLLRDAMQYGWTTRASLVGLGQDEVTATALSRCVRSVRRTG
jgi:hypothetical protein